MGIHHIRMALALTLSMGAAQAAPLDLVEARAAGMAVSAEFEGVLQAQRQATVASQVTGTVLAVAVKAGERVRAGAVIARIDDRDAQAGFERVQAAQAQADAELRNARKHFERNRDLRAQGFVSQAALDMAETQSQAAQAGLRQAQAAVAQAGVARAHATLRSPLDGIVLATHAEGGDLALPGRAIATVYQPGALRAVVHLSASHAATSTQGASVQLADGRWVKAARVTALPGADAVSQTVEWRLDLSDADSAGQRPGQSVRVRLAAAPATTASASAGLVLPASAVLQRGELSAVYVAQQGRFVLRAVRLGHRGADQVEVLAGLSAGERVARDAVRAGLSGATPRE